MRAHSAGTQCFSALFSVRISTVFRHCLTRKRIQEEHIMRAFPLHFYYFPALSSVRISTVFQHCRRAFLLHCSTLCMLFYYTPALYSSTVCVHFYYIQALFWLHLHTFVCVCMYLYHIPYTIYGMLAYQKRRENEHVHFCILLLIVTK